MFYHGVYHTLVMAPATSNTIAKCVAGISDNLATNVYAQAGKCRHEVLDSGDPGPVVLDERRQAGVGHVGRTRGNVDGHGQVDAPEHDAVVRRRRPQRQLDALAAVHAYDGQSERMCGAPHWIEAPYFGAGTVYCNRAPGHAGEHVAASAEEGVLASWIR